jgi:hypothetical protein
MVCALDGDLRTPPHELHQLATPLHRMVDDFLAYSAAEEPAQPAR